MYDSSMYDSPMQASPSPRDGGSQGGAIMEYTIDIMTKRVEGAAVLIVLQAHGNLGESAMIALEDSSTHPEAPFLPGQYTDLNTILSSCPAFRRLLTHSLPPSLPPSHSPPSLPPTPLPPFRAARTVHRPRSMPLA